MELDENEREKHTSLRKGDEACLLCSSSKIRSMESIEIPMFSCDPTSYNLCLNPHLWTTFVLRKLLDFPRSKCEYLLENMNGANPGDWVNICVLCSHLVREALAVHHQILMMQRQFQVFKKQVKGKLKRSICAGSEEGVSVTNELPSSARNFIRSYFRPQFIQPKVELELPLENENDFPVEDNFDGLLSEGEMGESGGEHFSSFADIKGTSSNADEVNELKEEIKFLTSIPMDARKTGGYIPRGLYSRHIQYKCPSCPVVFKSSVLLRLHIYKSHKKLTFSRAPETRINESAGSTPKSTASQARGKNVEENHKVNSGIQCDICHRRYSSAYKIVEHLKEHEMYEKTTCSICKFPCSSEDRLEQHSRYQHKSSVNPKPYFWKCGKCKYECTIPRHKYRHIIKHKFEDNFETLDWNLFKCKLCSETFTTLVKIRFHLPKAHGDKLQLRVFKCPRCDKYYHQKTHLKDHIKSVHENQRNFYCDQCGRGFLRLAEFEEHKIRHLSTEERELIMCDVCGKGYVTLRAMQSHKKYYHRENKPERLRGSGYKCNSCGIDLKTDKAFRLHKNTVHSDLFKYECKTCSKKFTSAGRLGYHEKKEHVV